MRMHFHGLEGVPIWTAGIAICLLAVSSVVTIFRSIPVSYANTSDIGFLSKRGAAPTGFGDAHDTDPQTNLAAPQDTNNHRIHASCPECGVIKPMRQIEHLDDAGGRNSIVAAVADDIPGREPDRAIAATSTVKTRYEFTVGFRDGSIKVFNDTSPRAWPLGSRVIVLGGSNASNY